MIILPVAWTSMPTTLWSARTAIEIITKGQARDSTRGMKIQASCRGKKIDSILAYVPHVIAIIDQSYTLWPRVIYPLPCSARISLTRILCVSDCEVRISHICIAPLSSLNTFANLKHNNLHKEEGNQELTTKSLLLPLVDIWDSSLADTERRQSLQGNRESICEESS